jgi:hypothetical protein
VALDSILTTSARQLGVMKPRPLATLHVGGNAVIDSGFTVTAGGIALPNGSVTTAMLAPGAAQQLIGSYVAGNSFATTTINAWVPTTATTGSIACSGAQCRIECGTQFYHSLAGAGVYTGLMVDGGVVGAMSYSIIPGASWTVQVGWTFYYTPPAGNRTFTLGLLTANAGTTTIQGAALTSLYVTEQRR